jgi:septum formation protein
MDGPPEEVVLENAFRKARAVAGDDPAPGSSPVLGVDTVVALGGRVYGKPPDAGAARRTLAELAGNEHTVVSGLCVVREGVPTVAVARTGVRFRALTDAEIDSYVATCEWRDRAGGYAIQGRGALLVSGVCGDYLNVVGLPVAELVRVAPELF